MEINFLVIVLHNATCFCDLYFNICVCAEYWRILVTHLWTIWISITSDLSWNLWDVRMMEHGWKWFTTTQATGVIDILVALGKVTWNDNLFISLGLLSNVCGQRVTISLSRSWKEGENRPWLTRLVSHKEQLAASMLMSTSASVFTFHLINNVVGVLVDAYTLSSISNHTVDLILKVPCPVTSVELYW